MSDDKLDRIEHKIDIVKEDISDIKITLADQHRSLVDHIQRTELLEKAIIPIQRHVDQVSGALKTAGVLALLATVITGVVDLLTYMRH